MGKIKLRPGKIITLSILLMILALLSADYWVNFSTRHLTYSNVDDIPYRRVGLLLGTSKYLGRGIYNQYFSHRIQAAETLIKAGKVDFVVISGDNSHKNYNEPLDMKEELIRRGIPSTKIYLDFAGFRTYDSVIRMNKIFGQTKFTVISQKFHNQRAIFIAQNLKLNAVGYNAQDVNAYFGFKTQLREKLARVKVMLDLLLHKKAKFLGEPVEIK